jgi:hypothetical protein
MGTHPFSIENFQGTPTIFKILASITFILIELIPQHLLIIGTMLILAFILIEWRSTKWPRYRRATLGTAIFLFNALVLVAITMMVISTLLAIEHHAHGH